MKSFFVICFLAIFAVGADESINWLEAGPIVFDMSPIMNLLTSTGFIADRFFGEEKPSLPSFAYQVGLLFKSSKGEFWCSGSLISTEYVLTAAHCADKRDFVIVYLGAHNITKRNDGEVLMKVPKSNFIIHEDWDSHYSYNDIALIRLPFAIQLGPRIQLVNLPSRSLSQSQLEGKRVTASGWLEYTVDYSTLLHYVHLKVIPVHECKISHQSYVRPITNICANNDGKSNCMGDSGDPLVFEEIDGSRTLVGLLSLTHFSGCLIGWPTVFTYIPPYLDWIYKYTGFPDY